MNDIENDKNSQKLLQIRLLYFYLPFQHKVVFKDFKDSYLLRTANLSRNSLLVKTISVACTIPCQRLFALNLISIGAILGRSLEENSCPENRRSDK